MRPQRCRFAGRADEIAVSLSEPDPLRHWETRKGREIGDRRELAGPSHVLAHGFNGYKAEHTPRDAFST
jgi:hypothetical protein